MRSSCRFARPPSSRLKTSESSRQDPPSQIRKTPTQTPPHLSHFNADSHYTKNTSNPACCPPLLRNQQPIMIRSPPPPPSPGCRKTKRLAPPINFTTRTNSKPDTFAQVVKKLQDLALAILHDSEKKQTTHTILYLFAVMRHNQPSSEKMLPDHFPSV